uniref:Retrotransposon gag domain-containing protein n=1 Tax=Brassica oleracea var. oleracea TaxID=109376 RepID=A0A0D3DLK7_BRAOL
MAVDKQNELPEATKREAELQRQLDGLRSQVTELHKTREETNSDLSSEVQSLKEKLNEHSKQLEQSAEKLSQLESENLNLRDENQALNTANVLQEARCHAVHRREDSRGSSPIRKSNPDSYADTPFTDEITLIEMPRKFPFPNIKAYDGTTNPDDHVAQYRQRMLAVALPKESREATMCKGFGLTLTRPALQWYINLPSRSIASFAILSDKFVEQFASSRDLEKAAGTWRKPLMASTKSSNTGWNPCEAT